jgi:hypothetical protein
VQELVVLMEDHLILEVAELAPVVIVLLVLDQVL